MAEAVLVAAKVLAVLHRLALSAGGCALSDVTNELDAVFTEGTGCSEPAAQATSCRQAARHFVAADALSCWLWAMRCRTKLWARWFRLCCAHNILAGASSYARPPCAIVRPSVCAKYILLLLEWADGPVLRDRDAPDALRSAPMQLLMSKLPLMQKLTSAALECVPMPSSALCTRLPPRARNNLHCVSEESHQPPYPAAVIAAAKQRQ